MACVSEAKVLQQVDGLVPSQLNHPTLLMMRFLLQLPPQQKQRAYDNELRDSLDQTYNPTCILSLRQRMP